MKIARAFMIFLALIAPAMAYEPDEVLADPALEARARAITQELRCLVCANESIDESHAPLAADLRRLVRERLTQGDSDGEVREFVVARYGDYVLLRPRFDPVTYVLWLGPFLLLALGFTIAWRQIARARRLENTPDS